MNFGNIKPFSIENGTGVRVSLFVSGCRNHCEQCFSRHTWDFDYGQVFDRSVEDQVIEMLKPEYCTGLTVLGGEPMEAENQKELLPFLKRVKEAVPEKTIWIYTGFVLGDDLKLYDNLQTGDMHTRAQTEYFPEILKLIDVLVDGRFEVDRKNISLSFRGSENQRIINVKETLKSGRITLLEL